MFPKPFTAYLTALVIPVALATSGCMAGSPSATESYNADAGAAMSYESAADASVQSANGNAAAAPSQPSVDLIPHNTPNTPNDTSFDAMFFENYGVNPFIETAQDHLSTFAMDVDTGSYSVARRYINEGVLPPADAIRVEEFINYFDQDYPSPTVEEGFAIHIDGAPTPFTEDETHQMMRVGIQGYYVSPEDRKDTNLTFVIDVSGSMNRENRLGLVKRSLNLLVDQMRPTDSVAIVTYAGGTGVVLEPTSGADKDTIRQALNRLVGGGSTNAEAGLRLGYELAAKSYNVDGINRVILASDGVANVGETGPDSIWQMLEDKASQGIYLTTVGFGMGNYNDVLMEQLADGGDGFYAYVDTINEAEKLFIHDLSSTLQVIGKDAKVQVDFNKEVVESYRLVGFENRDVADDDFRNDNVDAGEIGAGHNVTALYEVKLHPDAQGQIATAFIRWENPDTHEVNELAEEFFSEDMAPAFSDASARFQMNVLVAEYAEILKDSYWAQNSSMAAVLEEVNRVGGMLEQDEDVREFMGLVEWASRLVEQN